MTKEILDKAKELEQDIRAIENILKDRAEHKWIQVVSARTNNVQTLRFQTELTEWLKEKKSQYEKELEEL